MDILAVIPARGGSKGIIRKNLRLLNQKPLIYYQLQNSLKSKFITDTVVTSNDSDILNYSSNFPVNLRIRPEKLANDEVTLDPVVNDSMIHMESETGKKYDAIITLQPTSPLLSPKTLDMAIKSFIDNDLDTLIPVIDATHLHWKENHNSIVPDYDERLNRQWLPRKYKETGAFLLTKRNYVTDKSRFADNVNVFILDEVEGLDVDTDTDFLMAETFIKRLKIAFIVNGNKEVGLGHIHRSLTLADAFLGHNIKFVTNNSDSESIKMIKEKGYPVIKTGLDSLMELDSILIINDILDTEEDYIKSLKYSEKFVVNFEDLGDGSNIADLVFNALYERTNPQSNHRYGYEYECLNEQFLLHPPIEFKDSPETLLVTFGGVDQNNLTLKVLNVASKILDETPIKKMIIVLGGGYTHELNWDDINPEFKSKIEVIRKVENMAELMREVDIAVTSNGRTIYELAAMGIPTISIAQNDRETMHLFARYNNGVKYLGISCTLKEEDIFQSINEIAINNDLRYKMHLNLKEDSIVLRGGLTRIVDEITSIYWKWEHAQKIN